MPERQATSANWERPVYIFLWTVHAMVVPPCIEGFHDVGKSRKFGSAKWAEYKTDGTGFEAALSLAEQSAFVQKSNNVRACDVPERLDDETNNCNYESIVTT